MCEIISFNAPPQPAPKPQKPMRVQVDEMILTMICDWRIGRALTKAAWAKDEKETMFGSRETDKEIDRRGLHDKRGRTWQVDRPTPHDLRRTVATRLAELGIPEKDRDAESYAAGCRQDSLRLVRSRTRKAPGFGAVGARVVSDRRQSLYRRRDCPRYGALIRPPDWQARRQPNERLARQFHEHSSQKARFVLISTHLGQCRANLSRASFP